MKFISLIFIIFSIITIILFWGYFYKSYLKTLNFNETPKDKIQPNIDKSKNKYIVSNDFMVLGYPSYNRQLKEWQKKLMERKPQANDSELIEFLKQALDSPKPRGQIKMSRNLFLTPQAKEIKKLLNSKKEGFFVEAGGYDGERSSNTIYFEKKLNWKGLLVEPDPLFYTQLMGKQRASWSINACLSPYTFATWISFQSSLGGSGKIKIGKSDDSNVPCYPLESLMLALELKKIDFFSLDIEGAEGEVMKTIPFDRLDISTLAVEYSHGNKNFYRTFMENNGYEVVKDIHKHNFEMSLFVDDFIFKKKNLI